MAKFDDLLARVADEGVRSALKAEYEQVTKNKKFGLVFEEHLPECTPLWGVKIRRGMTVARKGGEINDPLVVQRIKDGVATCWHASAKQAEEIALADLIPIARFGDPIYPVLTPIDAVENAPGDKLWHTLIQADNYHALQLLEYLYKGKVDCIYIDPPYNTGARDWKYNNDYVDANDAYRHSKWLSMMQKRLHLAKELMNPTNSVLIITIDEKEYVHLGMLLEQVFPEAKIQMVTSVISAKGVVRAGQFSRVEEYIYTVQLGSCGVVPSECNMLEECVKKPMRREIQWLGFRRRAPQAKRNSRPNQFYPIFVDNNTGFIHSIGDVVPHGVDRNTVSVPPGCTALWPLSSDGDERLWSLVPEQARVNWQKGYLRVNGWRQEERRGTVYYLPEGTIADVETGKAVIDTVRPDGSIIAYYEVVSDTPPKRVWNMTTHNAETYGTNLIQDLVQCPFPYPKSLYAVHDVIRFYVANKKNALVVDFFAGSGTTLHALNLLNAEDGGERRCIMVTNNEVSEDEAKLLSEAGFKPGDDQWEVQGVAKGVTWPRTKCSILGRNIHGEDLDGEYLTNIPCEKHIPRTYYQIGFVKDQLSAEQKRKIVDLIGMPCGANRLLKNIKDIPDTALKVISAIMVPKGTIDVDCKYALSEDSTSSILFDADAADDWIEAIGETKGVTDLYIVTDKKRTYDEIKAKAKVVLGDVVVDSTMTIPMRRGFFANCAFFKLDFVDKDSVALGKQFKELLSILWMKSGAKGKCPTVTLQTPKMLVLPENEFAVLTDEASFIEFEKRVSAAIDVCDVYLVTDSNNAFKEMSLHFKDKRCIQLYRNYLDNFRINRSGR